jgi:hypothetical protein
MLETGTASGRSQDEPPATPAVEEVLAQALAGLGRSVGFDAARALAYDPDVLIPVSFTGTGSLLDWQHTVDLNLIAGRLSRAMVGGAATPQPATRPACGPATPASCCPPLARAGGGWTACGSRRCPAARTRS